MSSVVEKVVFVLNGCLLVCVRIAFHSIVAFHLFDLEIAVFCIRIYIDFKGHDIKMGKAIMNCSTRCIFNINSLVCVIRFSFSSHKHCVFKMRLQ